LNQIKNSCDASGSKPKGDIMARFVVDLGNMRLSDAQRNAIAGAIQQAVLMQLAPHTAATGAAAPAAAGSGNYGLFPIKWLGLIYRPQLGQLGQAENDIEPFANQQVP
jgi:hypothetical protein